MSLCDSCDVLISLIPFFQNGEAVDFESQSIYVNCDGDSAGIDFGLELVGIDLNDAATLTTVRNTLRKICNSNYCMMMKLEKPLHYRNYVLENVKTVIVFRVPRSKVHFGDQIIILLTGFKTVSEFSKFSQGLLILFVYLFFKRLQSDLFW